MDKKAEINLPIGVGIVLLLVTIILIYLFMKYIMFGMNFHMFG